MADRILGIFASLLRERSLVIVFRARKQLYCQSPQTEQDPAPSVEGARRFPPTQGTTRTGGLQLDRGLSIEATRNPRLSLAGRRRRVLVCRRRRCHARGSSSPSSRSTRSARSTVLVLTSRTAARSFAGGGVLRVWLRLLRSRVGSHRRLAHRGCVSRRCLRDLTRI